jgi:hypothetical protein
MKKKEETINPPDINKWLAGEILAKAGGHLPDDAPDSAKSGYNFRKDMDRMRRNGFKGTK